MTVAPSSIRKKWSLTNYTFERFPAATSLANSMSLMLESSLDNGSLNLQPCFRASRNDV